MKKLILFIAFNILAIIIVAQEIQHETIAINIEVPVRVYKGGKFIDNLTIDDFEVYEDGKLQKIEAVYLIKKTNIEREDVKIDKETARKIFSPQLSRQFILIFEIRDFLPKVEEAIWYFFEKVIIPGDKLIVATPMRTYNFKEDSWEVVSKTEIASQLIEKLRRDALVRPLDWSDLKDYTEDAEGILTGIKEAYMSQRYIEEKRLIDIAEYLKKLPGQKNVFLFFQQELIDFSMPTPVSSITGIWAGLDYLNYMSMIASYNSISPKRIKRAFSDSSILFHFLYLKDESYFKNIEFEGPGSILDKFSTSIGIFDTFSELSKATGGITQTTVNAVASFKTAVDATENYYLVYYAPKNYKSNGEFRNIKIKITNKNYRVIHRAGYIAD
jgi:VWFA-related protein